MTKTNKNKNTGTCNFCGRSSNEVNALFNGLNDAYICDACVQYANSILEQNNISSMNKEIKQKDKSFIVPTPHEIKQYLDEHVIGQDMAKTRLSVAVYNHYKRVIKASNKKSKKSDSITIEKSNILMIGDTGVGKTELARSIAKLLNVPFVIADATSLTQAGYVGEDVESMLTKLLQAADGNIKEAERGIIFLDEIDKLARKGKNPSITRDVSGEGVQQGLLKLLEGADVSVQKKLGRRNPTDEYVTINTNNILFICSGAFDGLRGIIESRMNKREIGFIRPNEDTADVTEENMLQYVNAEDIKQYGLISEIVGRLPIITYLDPLSDDMLCRILTEPKNSIIKQYEKLFKLDGITLKIDNDVYPYIVEKAQENKLGARALRGIVENIMTYAMFDMPSKKSKKKNKVLHITKEFAMNELCKFHMEKYRKPLLEMCISN